MGDLSLNFSRSEFACKGEGCCGQSSPISLELIDSLELLREQIGHPLIVSSGFRCNNYNTKVGGAPSSQHTQGVAADIILPEGIAIADFLTAAEKIRAFRHGGIGVYPNWLHLDTRQSGKVRWKG